MIIFSFFPNRDWRTSTDDEEYEDQEENVLCCTAKDFIYKCPRLIQLNFSKLKIFGGFLAHMLNE